jgi:hypothetical protein
VDDLLPISLNSYGIFDNDAKAQAPVFVKLEAWFNFQALTLQWFADESNVNQWHVTKVKNTQVLIRTDIKLTEIKFVLNNDDLKDMMEGRIPVESFFQSLALLMVNEQAVLKGLPPIPAPNTMH